MRAIVSNASAITITMVASALLGYPYWWLAARQFPPAAVGLAAAVTSAMTLLGTLGVLGLGTLVVAELPRRKGRELTLISTATCGGALGALALGAAFALLGSSVSLDFAVLGSPWPFLLFAVGSALTAAGLVLDQAFIGLLRGGLQILRYLLFGIGKLVALGLIAALLPLHDGLAICLSWVVGVLLSIVPVGRLLSGQRIAAVLPDWTLLHGQGRTALAHHVLNTGLQLPYMIMPVVVTTILSATDNAYFYAAWMIANMVFLMCGALTAVLYAMGTREPEALTSHTRFTLALGIGGAAVGSLVLVIVAEPLLTLLFGPGYAEHATPVLRILVIGSFPLAIVDHYVALSRIAHRTMTAAKLVVAGGVLQVVMAAVGSRLGGLEDLTLGWVLGVALTAVWMLPLVYRTVVADSVSVRPLSERHT